MNESETIYTEGGSGSAQVQNELASLRFLLFAALFIFFIFSLGLDSFLWRQGRLLSVQLAEEQNLVFQYENGGSTQVVDFWVKLNEYSRQHPDFNPIIAKYSQFLQYHPAAGSAPAPAAAPTAVPKKK